MPSDHFQDFAPERVEPQEPAELPPLSSDDTDDEPLSDDK